MRLRVLSLLAWDGGRWRVSEVSAVLRRGKRAKLAKVERDRAFMEPGCRKSEGHNSLACLARSLLRYKGFMSESHGVSDCFVRNTQTIAAPCWRIPRSLAKGAG